MDINPYAPPQSRPGDYADANGVWNEGKGVVRVLAGCDLPGRCVKCNAPALMPVKKRDYTWNEPWVLLLFLAGILIYVIVALITRKRASLSPGLCAEHAARRMKFLWSGLAAIAASIGLGVYAISAENGGLILLALFATLAAIIVTVLTTRLVNPVEITKDYARYKGCGEEFLRSLGGLPKAPPSLPR